MYFVYILFLTLAAASNGLIIKQKKWNDSLTSGEQEGNKTKVLHLPTVNVNCTQDQFKCSNGQCIPGEDQCDGGRTCYDRSDEFNCTSCTGGAFRCGDGKCIPTDVVCNQYNDCEDGSDENNCTNRVCGSGEFRCQSGQCIDKCYRCDGWKDCADKSDEENCLECSGSVANPFKCVSINKCIKLFEVCDSIKDCPDGSDEDEAFCQNNPSYYFALE